MTAFLEMLANMSQQNSSVTISFAANLTGRSSSCEKKNKTSAVQSNTIPNFGEAIQFQWRKCALGINKMHCARTEMITVYKTSILDNQFNGKLNKLDWWIKLLFFFFFFRIEKNLNERKKNSARGVDFFRLLLLFYNLYTTGSTHIELYHK